MTRDITDRVQSQKEKQELIERLNRLKKMAALGMLAGGQITITTANRRFDEPHKGYTEIGAGDYAALKVLDSGQGISEEIHPTQKANITSGFAETDPVKEARQLGAGGYLRKPYTVEELGRAIKMVLRRAHR